MATPEILPEGWTIRTIWNPTLAKTGLRGFYWAYCFHEERVILLLPRWWVWPVWPLIRGYALAHEQGHAWGIPASGCLDGHPWCIMGEETMLGYPDGSWKGKALLLLRQLMPRRRWGKFCLTCKAYLDARIWGDEDRAAEIAAMTIGKK